MKDEDRLFRDGRPEPREFGLVIRGSAGQGREPASLAAAEVRLGRPAFLVDGEGYECELLGAAIHPAGAIAWVESRAKDVGTHIDISIRIHLKDASGDERQTDIESYNPFFGCDIGYFEWIGQAAILIYREKHATYACRFGDLWPPRFARIEDRWAIRRDVLTFTDYRRTSIRRLSLPELNELPPATPAEAAELDPLLVGGT